MDYETTSRLLAETTVALDKARRLLESLVEAKSETERHLSRLRRPDAFATVAGRSAIDNAIVSTQRLIESLERAADRLARGGSLEAHAHGTLAGVR